jgi:hypothetical protein
MQVDYAQAERDAAAGIAAAKAETFERVVHPVIQAPERKCFRVIRLFLLAGHLGSEHIGAASSAREAMAISTSEQWRAQVLDPDDRIYADNWRSMERR